MGLSNEEVEGVYKKLRLGGLTDYKIKKLKKVLGDEGEGVEFGPSNELKHKIHILRTKPNTSGLGEDDANEAIEALEKASR